jgi:hypothetical protein
MKSAFFTKPTGRHHAEYRFSPDIDWDVGEYASLVGITFEALVRFVPISSQIDLE